MPGGCRAGGGSRAPVSCEAVGLGLGLVSRLAPRPALSTCARFDSNSLISREVSLR